jgi:hypothetical protein
MTVPYGYQDPLGNTEQRIFLFQNNGAVLTFNITDPNNNYVPVNITGATILFTRKGTRFLLDTDPTAIQYSGDLTNPSEGVCTVTIPSTDNLTPGVSWYRLDVIQSGQPRTATCGPLEVVAV